MGGQGCEGGGSGRRQRSSMQLGCAANAALGMGMLDPGMEMITKPFAVDALAHRIRTMIEG